MKGSKKQKTFTREEIDAAIYAARHTAKSANEMQTIDILGNKPEISVAELDKLTRDINGLLDSAFDLLIKIIDEES